MEPLGQRLAKTEGYAWNGTARARARLRFQVRPSLRGFARRASGPYNEGRGDGSAERVYRGKGREHRSSTKNLDSAFDKICLEPNSMYTILVANH